jgi:hypothetical protein
MPVRAPVKIYSETVSFDRSNYFLIALLIRTRNDWAAMSSWNCEILSMRQRSLRPKLHLRNLDQRNRTMIRLTLVAAVFAAVCGYFVVSASATVPEQNTEKRMSGIGPAEALKNGPDGQQKIIRRIAQQSDFPTRRKRGVGGRVPPDPNKGKTTDGQQEKMGSDLQHSDFPTRRKRGGGGRVPGDPY